MGEKLLIGVDLGGTNIRAAAAASGAPFTGHVARRTPAQDGPAAVLDAVAAAVREVSGDRRPDGVAIGIPGPLDPEKGVVFDTPHLKGWKNVEAMAMLSERTGCPVAIHNDASLAGYAEWVAGAGKGTTHMIFMTASTGIGGALIVDGELVGGVAGTAGEIGHVPLARDAPACGQGHRGCLEGTASGTAIARRAREAVARGEQTSMSGMDPDAIDATVVEKAAKAGDALAQQIWTDAGLALGRSLGGLINMLSPEVIVIGGGLINAGDLLFEPLNRGVGDIAFDVPRGRCRIVEAGLGTDAGLVGAVRWAVKSFAGGER